MKEQKKVLSSSKMSDERNIANGYDADEVTHYKLFHQNERFSYYCSDEGCLYRKGKEGIKKPIQGQLRGRYNYCIKLEGKYLKVKDIIMDAFNMSIPDDCEILFADGNPKNCSIGNMVVHKKTKAQASKVTN